ncbi:MAG: 5-formyltetrahydrofolate cyclo-ligase [Porticoccaceae bacterium]|jgi:5-formyltetrahydrofolate cyclo-ligase|nr:5-formyltetrahydrofolate cyclo-ligase [Porticoccaceae bacterium]MBT6781079.1 5-formyltetrahydrofolate cyclo-ligase [Porticoccaceae bacterium]|tara:strand:+ start:17238 stop:17828 length:591 start_codon:yes stop_codon:yes gene_type:complete
MSINDIRKQLRVKRRSLSPQLQHSASEQLASYLCNESVFIDAQKIGFYIANDGEIDPAALMASAENLNKQCFLPIVGPNKTNNLYFGPFDANTKLKPNRYGILEPSFDEGKIVFPQSLDVLFMPLVGFDRQGNRIGMGGGYYDRALAFMKEQETSSLTLVGLAHSIQEVPQISSQSWDIPLHLIATEKELICARPR